MAQEVVEIDVNTPLLTDKRNNRRQKCYDFFKKNHKFFMYMYTFLIYIPLHALESPYFLPRLILWYQGENDEQPVITPWIWALSFILGYITNIMNGMVMMRSAEKAKADTEWSTTILKAFFILLPTLATSIDSVFDIAPNLPIIGAVGTSILFLALAFYGERNYYANEIIAPRKLYAKVRNFFKDAKMHHKLYFIYANAGSSLTNAMIGYWGSSELIKNLLINSNVQHEKGLKYISIIGGGVLAAIATVLELFKEQVSWVNYYEKEKYRKVSKIIQALVIFCALYSSLPIILAINDISGMPNTLPWRILLSLAALLVFIIPNIFVANTTASPSVNNLYKNSASPIAICSKFGFFSILNTHELVPINGDETVIFSPHA